MRRFPLISALVLVCALLMTGTADAALGVQRTWAGKQIRAYDAMAAGRYGQGVTVAVLDGWVDRAHPDFGGRVLPGADCHTGSCVTRQTRDECGSNHGTHVAGTVGASSYGMAPRATLLPIRVLSDDGEGGCEGDANGVAAGIRWALAHGADVLNLSLGPDVPRLGSDNAISQAVKDAAAAGVVVVFSAGNADLPVAQSYGANALVVAATGPSGKLADYSQHGQGVSVAAPGGQPDSNDTCRQDGANCITSLYPGGRYAVAAGTSMAAPHVSGIAALLLAQRPTRGRQNVLDRITRTAHALSGAGYGRVDAAAALGVTGTAPSPKPEPAVQPTRKARPPAVTYVAPRPRPAATRTVLRASPTPSPTPVVATPAPQQTRPPVVVVPPVLVAAPRVADHPVPIVLAGVAGGLAGLAGAAVMLAGLTQPRVPRKPSTSSSA